MEKSIFKVKVKILEYVSYKPWIKETYQGIGTGFCIKISNKNYIITNNHVIENCYLITVNGKETSVLFSDVILDLALLECVVEDAVPLEIGMCEIGDRIDLYGYPIISGLSEYFLTKTTGIISRYGKIMNGIIKKLCYVADVRSCNGGSGGPACNAEGNVVGILSTGFLSKSCDNYSGIIPYFIINYFIKNFLNDTIEYKYFDTQWQKIYPELQNYLGLKNQQGIILWDGKKSTHVTEIEGIKIYENGKIKISDILKYLGYKSNDDHMISFTYVIPFLNKDTINLGGKQIKLPSQRFNNFTENEYAVYGDYVFIPVTLKLTENFSGIPLDKVFITYCRTSKYFLYTVLDIDWKDFIKKLGSEKNIMVFDLWQKAGIFILDPNTRVNTKKTLVLFN